LAASLGLIALSEPSGDALSDLNVPQKIRINKCVLVDDLFALALRLFS
jgi:hypothetical protein